MWLNLENSYNVIKIRDVYNCMMKKLPLRFININDLEPQPTAPQENWLTSKYIINPDFIHSLVSQTINEYQVNQLTLQPFLIDEFDKNHRDVVVAVVKADIVCDVYMLFLAILSYNKRVSISKPLISELLHYIMIVVEDKDDEFRKKLGWGI